MAHSLVQEMTMVTDFIALELAENEVYRLRDLVSDEGADPVALLEGMGVRPSLLWVAELKGSDDNLDLEQDSDLEYD